VDVAIGLRESLANALAASGMMVPVRVRVRGLIDTGAEITCIDPAIRVALELEATGRLFPRVPFGPSQGRPCNAFRVSLAVLHPGGNPADSLTRPVWMVAELPVAHTGAEVLIGNDLLDECEFLRDGPGQSFSLGY
jgi:hypothetical protein